MLLDTHVLVWAVENDARLGRRAADQINRAGQTGDLRISAITPWEVSMLVTKGRVSLAQDIGAWFQTVLAEPAIRLVPIAPEIGIHAGQLPRSIHDPADRIIIATAITLGCPLMTMDRSILDYARSGHLQVVDARL